MMTKILLATSAMLMVVGIAHAQTDAAPPPPAPPGAPAANQQPGAHPHKMRESAACKEDREKFCADAKGRAVGKCMHEHMADLSQACKDSWKNHKKMEKAD